ncbi:MAG: AraC family transcriptional regulator [Planctomycetota bacterium]|nr:AraC family transcriptional regulator [Planctomycetota bacterium]
MVSPTSNSPSILRRSTPVPQNLGSNGLWAFESRHDQAFSMGTTTHSFFKLLWIREGHGSIEMDCKQVRCETGDLVLLPARLPHRIVDSAHSPISLYGLGIDFRQLTCVSLILPSFIAGVYREPKFQTLRIEQHLRKILYLNDQEDAPSLLSSVATAMNLLAELALVLVPPKSKKSRVIADQRTETEHPTDPLLEAYLEWLHRNFYELLTLDEAAFASGMSRRTFTNEFKARTGATWLEYVNRLRIHHAKELMKQTDRKVTSIAFQCGFDDLTTFYRAFKRITGSSPTQMRG